MEELGEREGMKDTADGKVSLIIAEALTCYGGIRREDWSRAITLIVGDASILKLIGSMFF